MNRKILPMAITAATMSVAGLSNAEINMNGFATVGTGLVLTEGKSYGGYDEKLRFDSGSNVGLQFSSDMGDGLNATAQFIARGSDNWSVEAEWAYISYEVTDSIKVIAGKQRSPFYMYSDYVDVGYAYHWVTPPDGVYSLPFDSTNALALVSNNYFGDLDSTFQVLVGRNNQEINFNGPSKMDSYNTFTVNWTGVYEFATFRLGYSKGKLDIGIDALNDLTTPWEDIEGTVRDYTYAGAYKEVYEQTYAPTYAGNYAAQITAGADEANAVLAAETAATAAATAGAEATATAYATAAAAAVADIDGQKISDGIKIDEDDVTFAGVGVTLDFDTYFFVAELTRLDLGDSLVGLNTSSYIGAGYRMNDFTFHATYGMDEDKTSSTLFDDIDPNLLDKDHASYVPALAGLTDAAKATLEAGNAKSHYITVGTRWDFHPSSALKLDMTQYVNDLAEEDAETSLFRLALTTVF